MIDEFKEASKIAIFMFVTVTFMLITVSFIRGIF
jgi:hypothetical protein